ncbi:MAG TPA: PRD domain-containing protein [Tissierellales bacterium]|nr:PRD domain-containing protein [Tissierellales bacterium]
MDGKKKFTVSKALNNNVILVVDKKTNEELVLVGKGIGFGKKENKEIVLEEEEIEKSFVAFDESTKKDYYRLMNQLNSKVIGVSEEIIAMAESKFGTLNSHIHIALTDHIGFTMDRLKMGLEISNPFLYEIKVLYPEEYKIGEKAAGMIKERLGISISESEIGFIALHIHSARENREVSETVKDFRFLKELISIIEKESGIIIDNNSLDYNRLINHLRLTLNRLEEKKYIKNPLLEAIKVQFDDSYTIATKIGKHIEENKDIDVKDDELGYMALHIERIKETSNFISRRVTE